MSWKRMKGIVCNCCSRCGGVFVDSEFDFSEDSCLFCLFEGSSPVLPVLIDRSFGYNRNVTAEGELLANIDYIPEKQSAASQKANRAFKERTYLSTKVNKKKGL